MINIQFQIRFGQVTKEEKSSIKRKEMDLDIHYLMKNLHIQVLYLQDIIKMAQKYLLSKRVKIQEN